MCNFFKFNIIGSLFVFFFFLKLTFINVGGKKFQQPAINADPMALIINGGLETPHKDIKTMTIKLIIVLF